VPSASDRFFFARSIARLRKSSGRIRGPSRRPCRCQRESAAGRDSMESSDSEARSSCRAPPCPSPSPSPPLAPAIDTHPGSRIASDAPLMRDEIAPHRRAAASLPSYSLAHERHSRRVDCDPVSPTTTFCELWPEWILRLQVSRWLQQHLCPDARATMPALRSKR